MGETGFIGMTGVKGDQGEHGTTGSVGPQGDAGQRGERGEPGENGDLGDKGFSGPSGDRGPPGKSKNVKLGFLLVKHSQTARVPRCPLNMQKLWEGYSLLYLEGQERAYSQDLGQAGSCVRVFSTMPFSVCGTRNCHYAGRNDKAYWLSTMAEAPNRPFSREAIQQHISRCVVCEAPSAPVALHDSTSNNTPDCPRNWISLWTGYSFIMFTGGGDEGGGLSLQSPGSCLSEFKAQPFVECQGARGTCHFFANVYSFWLTNIRSTASVLTDPEQQREHVAKCRVCMRM